MPGAPSSVLVPSSTPLVLVQVHRGVMRNGQNSMRLGLMAILPAAQSG